MSREITKDYQELLFFFENYSISKIAKKKEYISVVSQVHKRYFAYLTIVAELSFLSKEGSLTPPINETQLKYLKESCSDIGNAIFSLVNGSYKPANLVLRSSIETFLKGFNLDDYPGITTEKSLYKIFDNVKSLAFFLNEPKKSIFTAIHQDYVSLCAETHTASTANMAHITSMNYFPQFDKDKATNIAKTMSRLVENYTSILLLKYKDCVNKIHFKNKQNILSILPGEIKRMIQGID